MALDNAAKESNLRDSLKKYFVDSIETAGGVPVSFDKALSAPDLQGKTVDRWVNFVMGPVVLDTMSDVIFELFLCTRRDNEGYKLSQLRDKVLATLVDDTSADGRRRITLYQSSPTTAWVELGKLLVWEIIPSGDLIASDETKFKVITVILKVAMKI
jgi:hypothetical protein